MCWMVVGMVSSTVCLRILCSPIPRLPRSSRWFRKLHERTHNFQWVKGRNSGQGESLGTIVASWEAQCTRMQLTFDLPPPPPPAVGPQWSARLVSVFTALATISTAVTRHRVGPYREGRRQLVGLLHVRIAITHMHVLLSPGQQTKSLDGICSWLCLLTCVHLSEWAKEYMYMCIPLWSRHITVAHCISAAQNQQSVLHTVVVSYMYIPWSFIYTCG